jgi:uncharacterized protein (DUF2236 family)
MNRPYRLHRAVETVTEGARRRMAEATLSLFQYAPYPLENTLEYRGDPGLMGPGSISWRLIADPAAFVGGIRALLIQAAHPEVVAGVEQHSRYRGDPLGRLSRTSAYVTATTFGAMPEVEAAIDRVRRAHRVVRGISSRGVFYDASDPDHAAWVHNALTDSFLVANHHYSDYPLTVVEADRFVAEQARVGNLIGADPVPTSADDLSTWIESHPDMAASPDMKSAVEFLTDPPLPLGVKTGYLVLLEAAIATLPSGFLEILGLRPKPGAETLGRAAVNSLRWALGYSPSWALALIRCGEPLPEGLFRRIPNGVLERVAP